MPITEKSMREREGEILDQYALKQITKAEAIVLLTELHQDFFEALTIINEQQRNSK